MAYNLRSRLTSEGSSVAPRSEGMNLSPVELAVPMSEQTPTTAGYGLDLLGPVVIEGSPEALQTVAMQAPFTSQIDSDTTVADVETDELILFKIMLFVCAWVLTELLPHPVYAWNQTNPLSISGEKNFHSSIA